MPSRHRVPSLTRSGVPLLLAGGWYLAGCSPAAAQTSIDAYPARPVRMLIGYAPGTSVDVGGRFLAQRLTEALGQSFVVDNRPGATGAIAAEAVARSAPDGYTLTAAPGSGVVDTPRMQKVAWDPLRGFAPVSLMGEFAFLLAAHPALPARTAKNLIALARQRPRELACSSNGVGSAFHLAGVLFAQMARVELVHVPYRGGGNALVDVMGGQIHLLWNSPVFLIPQIKAGKLTAIGVTGPKRIAALPDIPTITSRALERQYHLPPGVAAQAFVGHRGAGDVPA
jgi:tripartite-type tricarboxylate transporter receptor subunit TctC